MLDPDVRRELRSLTRETADLVSRHLVMTGRLLDDDPQQALAHGRAARAMAGRIGVVREACGLAAYAAGEWNEALADLRAARRITGRAGHLAVLADCERALGRPERALAYADDPDVATLDQEERVELVIVLSGARRDLGQVDAAVLALQDPARRTTAARPWAARLWYAHADALLHAGRTDEARTWFEKVVGIDPDGSTDAGDRLLELDGVVLHDLDDEGLSEDEDGAAMPDEELAAYVAEAFPRPAPAPEVQAEVAASPPVDDVPPAPVPQSSVPAPVFAAPAPPEAPETSRPASGPAPLPVFASPPQGRDTAEDQQ
jgi:tetratricopeptide (TPR) repeat protein